MRILVLAGCGIFLGVSGYTFFYAKGASYLSEDPAACVNCHIMNEQYASWQKSSHHANASCVQCHLPHDTVGKYLAKMSNGYHHSVKFTFQNFDYPIQIKPHNLKILNQSCLECHSNMVSEINHSKRYEGEFMNCVQCHSRVGHGANR